MMPLKYSNFLVAATAVLPVLSTLCFGPSLCYYFITVRQGGGEVQGTFLLAVLYSNGWIVNCVWVIVTFFRTD